MRQYTIIEAPSPLGLWPSGVERTPEILLQMGLARALNARRGPRVEPPEYDPVRDAATHMLNPHGLVEYSPRLADAVGEAVDMGEFPIVLGGDCTILLGCILALRRRGRHGLLFLDGHADFYQPEASPTGEGADMELGLVSGRGPDIVVNLEDLKPYVRDEDIVVFAFRDADIAREHGSRDVRASGMNVMDLHDVHKAGAEHAAAEAVGRLAAGDVEGFWIHLDVDVLNDAIIPAVDYRIPGGLDFDELVAVMRTAIADGRAVGLDLTIFNPNLDPNRTLARNLVDVLRRGLVG